MKHLIKLEVFDPTNLESPWVVLADKVYYSGMESTSSSPNIVITLNVPSDCPNEIPLGGGDFAIDDHGEWYDYGLYFTPSTECEDIILDGTSIGAVDYYNVSKGEHTIEYVMKDKTKIYDDQFNSFGPLGIQTVKIPNSVTYIGISAFCYCTSLISIVIPNSVTSIDENAFSSCSSLKSITIGNSVTSIGDTAFYYCTGLTSITIPNSVISIGNDAFNNCSGLTSITIPNSVISIGNDAFLYCTNLISVTYNGTEYTSISALTTALTTNDVTVGNNVFLNSGLSD